MDWSRYENVDGLLIEFTIVFEFLRSVLDHLLVLPPNNMELMIERFGAHSGLFVTMSTVLALLVDLYCFLLLFCVSLLLPPF